MSKEKITRIPEKREGAAVVLYRSDCVSFRGLASAKKEEFQITVGVCASKPQSGGHYRTFSMGIAVVDEEDLYLIRRNLKQLAVHQMAEDAKLGELVLRVYPEVRYDEGQRTVFVYMRYCLRNSAA